jgi:formamidopyrimidine-DNA glycosylase
VGNWIADEVLYQARLAPHRTVGSLSPEELDRMRLKLRAIVKTAVRVQARKDLFPKTWLFHHRWGKGAGAKVRGEEIRFEELAGRTTAWVPAVQR